MPSSALDQLTQALTGTPALGEHLSQIRVAGAEAVDSRALDPVLLDEVVPDIKLFGGRKNRRPVDASGPDLGEVRRAVAHIV